ncbi:S-layer homology domain-containing protein [Paenibacillus sp. LHD-117]|uniref:S-layer homology domain-containing protein n=1 Tax=Paenibacillus sp. LHD-117 TaxID=3071412 RepID=UPI0027E0DE1A|nr:S-layer homology domain-containing protein [Paenibacillus sp. LHD-117]MDQ6421198.1 S-layer homology domain-containing protein [Paenibacillus sp. LHD-117]
MLKHRRAVYFGLATLLLGVCVGFNDGARAAASSNNVKISKSYELTDKVDFVEFTIEGYDGAFTSTLTLPNGRVVQANHSNQINDPEGVYWTNDYAVESPPAGTYTFTILAPVHAYYNLVVDIPLFSDIAGHWAKADIATFVNNGIVNGYGNGKFGPNDFVTGEALVKMIVLALTEEQPHGNRQWARLFRWKVWNEDLALEMGLQEYNFAQAVGNDWRTAYLAAADDLGILSNWDVTQLKKPFARKDVALMIANVMNLVNEKAPAPKAYTDTGGLPKEIQNAISRVSGSAIFAGYPDGSFQPNKVVTRAEAVKVLARLTAYLNS